MSAKIKIESGVQLLARLTKKPNIEKFYPAVFQEGPKIGDMIEIFSDTCTSNFLIDVISEALIFSKYNGVAAGVLVFNTDGNLDFDELISVIKKKIWSISTYENLEKIGFEMEVTATLANLHILNIYDTTQFYVTIYNLESMLVEHPNISLIIFNTLTAFYWSEQGFKITKMDLYTKNLINTIQKVTKEYKTICMYTRPEYFCTNKGSEDIPAELNYQIQIIDNDRGNYQANIKTSKIKITNFFKVVDGDLIWL